MHMEKENIHQIYERAYAQSYKCISQLWNTLICITGCLVCLVDGKFQVFSSYIQQNPVFFNLFSMRDLILQRIVL